MNEHANQLEPQRFDQWAIVELFGHQRIAGRVTEQTVGGSSFVRVDVPAVEQIDTSSATQAFTKLFGPAAIYSISFVDEAAAMLAARDLRVQPIDSYSLRRALEDLPALGIARQAGLPLDDDRPPF